jgi:hypothetical protein
VAEESIRGGGGIRRARWEVMELTRRTGHRRGGWAAGCNGFLDIEVHGAVGGDSSVIL